MILLLLSTPILNGPLHKISVIVVAVTLMFAIFHLIEEQL